MLQYRYRLRSFSALGLSLALCFGGVAPAEASEVVKLARLVLTGKRSTEPAQQAPQPSKPAPISHDNAERLPRVISDAQRTLENSGRGLFAQQNALDEDRS